MLTNPNRKPSSSTPPQPLLEWHSLTLTLTLTLDSSPASTRVAAYGYGLVWNHDTRGVSVVRHSGGLPGYGSEWRFLPQHAVCIVAFGNKTYCNMSAANAVAMDLLLTRGVAQAVVPPTADILRIRAAQLARIISSGFDLQTSPDAQPDGTWGSNIFAANFFLDRPLPLWEKQCRCITDRLGPIQFCSLVSPLVGAQSSGNDLRGSFLLTGQNGDSVRVFFTLSPEPSPKVQEVVLQYVGFKAHAAA